jgi:hypothetical protein
VLADFRAYRATRVVSDLMALGQPPVSSLANGRNGLVDHHWDLLRSGRKRRAWSTSGNPGQVNNPIQNGETS